MHISVKGGGQLLFQQVLQSGLGLVLGFGLEIRLRFTVKVKVRTWSKFTVCGGRVAK